MRPAALLLTLLLGAPGVWLPQSPKPPAKPPSLLPVVRSASTSEQTADERPYCTGTYADDFAALSPAARAYDSRPGNQYTFCVRTTAVYECLSYGPDGNIRRDRKKVVAHGTAFAYRRSGKDTLLLTNEHVADWPAVTDDDHPVDGVPNGCKRVSSALKIVDNEEDAYARDDIPLSRVVTAPLLDMAVLEAPEPLTVMPWKIGHSADLRERNVVDVRGFPLGAFQATSVGKVISAYDHDDDHGWDHDDFVIDALLSPGNSGSPVFAISCKTGQFELVGVYHAAYTDSSALNVVVGIDQIRSLMRTLHRPPHKKSESFLLDAATRAQLVSDLRADPEPYFPFGPLTAVARPQPDGAILFELMPKDFPVESSPALVIEDLPGDDASDFGKLGRVWAGNAQGLSLYTRARLDGDALGKLEHLLDGLRHDALAAFRYAAAAREGDTSRAHFDQMKKQLRALHRDMKQRSDLAQTALDLSGSLAPKGPGPGLQLADILASPSSTPVASKNTPKADFSAPDPRPPPPDLAP